MPMKRVPCDGLPSAGLVVILMMALAGFCGGIGAILEFTSGDLGFQAHYIAENGLDVDTDVEEMLGETYDDLKQDYIDQLSPMEHVTQMIVGNVAKIGTIVGGVIGAVVGTCIVAFKTGGYLDENGWYISDNSIEDDFHDGTSFMCHKKIDGKERYSPVKDRSHSQTSNGVMMLDSKSELLSSKDLENRIQNGEKIKTVQYRQMGAVLTKKKSMIVSFCLFLVMLTLGVLTYNGVIPAMAGAWTLVGAGFVTIVGAFIAVFGVSCAVCAVYVCKQRRRLQATFFANDQLPLCIVLLISCVMIVCYVLEKINARAKATAAHLEQVVVKL